MLNSVTWSQREYPKQPTYLLTWQEPWNVLKRDQRNVKSIAKPHKPCPLDGRGDIQTPYRHKTVKSTPTHLTAPPTCFGVGLVGHDAHGLPVHPGKSHDDVLGVARHDFKEVVLVYDGRDDVVYVVRLVGRVRDDVIQTRH